jgi:hypothetical protein
MKKAARRSLPARGANHRAQERERAAARAAAKAKRAEAHVTAKQQSALFRVRR